MRRAVAAGRTGCVTRALTRWRPDCIPAVLAADPARGWLLTPDRGPRLREVFLLDPDIRHWYCLLPAYASLQIELAHRVDQLLALGVPDRRPELLPVGYAHLLEDSAALHLGRPGGITSDERWRPRQLTARFAALCAELTGSGVPLTLHHGDCHDGNIFRHDDRYLFFDWETGA